MTRYADPERCPSCLGPMPFGSTRCPSCGLSLEGPLAARLFTALSTADALLAEMRAPAPTTVPGPATVQAAATPSPVGVVPPRSSSASTLQTVRHGLSAASVPKILLGLGALCLLVAALVFLAVTWAEMGIGGRTATLVGFTAVAGGLTAWSAHRGLRAAAESLGVVALGLLSLDLFGARDAGWLGEISTPGFLVLLGLVLVATGASSALAVRRTPAKRLVGAEVIATLGLATASLGAVEGDWFTRAAGLTVAVVTCWALAYAAHTVRLDVLTAGAVLTGAVVWLILAVLGADRALTHASLTELWWGLEVWPLLVAGILVAGFAFVTSLPLPARLAAVSVATIVLSAIVMAPFSDEPVTTAVLAAALLLVLVSVTTWFTPAAWRPGLGAPLGLGVVAMVAASVQLGGLSVDRLWTAGAARWDGEPGTVLPAAADDGALAGWLLPILVLSLLAGLAGLARSFDLADRWLSPAADLEILAAVGAATVVLTVAAYAVPLWLVLGLVLGTGAGFATRALVREAPLALALAGAALAAGLAVSLHDEWLTLTALVPILAAAFLTHLRWVALEVAAATGALAAMSLAGVVWTLGAVSGGEPSWTVLGALLALAAVVLGMPYVDTRVRRNSPAGVARLGFEIAALVTAAFVSVVGLDRTSPQETATWAAVYLTVSGATASAMALLRPDRRAAGWLGGLLLAAATWVRLADLGVDTPEAYTLPSALALLAVGMVHLRREPDAGTMAALTPGLLLALTPSLLWVLVDPVALRSVLLGVACLGLVVGGIGLRWNAPVVHASVVGAILVLRHATPVAEAVPRWALIGAAGALLVAMGITWEQRLREARTVAGYVRALR